MFYFKEQGTLILKDVKKIDYDRYWSERSFEVNKKLKEREIIIFNMIPSGAGDRYRMWQFAFAG